MRTDRMWQEHLQRVGGREMYDRDPTYRASMSVLRDFVRHLGIVLEDEGIPPELAERIVRGVLYGSPNVADAEQRMRDRELIAEALMHRPIRIEVPLSLDRLPKEAL